MQCSAARIQDEAAIKRRCDRRDTAADWGSVPRYATPAPALLPGRPPPAPRNSPSQPAQEVIVI